MKERTTYIGTLKGVKGIWCDKKPKGLEVDKTITWYSADEGKVFADKEGNLVESVIIQDGVKIEDYVEIKDPRPQPEDHIADDSKMVEEEPKEEN